MAETLNQYKSALTPQQVDAALNKIRQVDDSIAQAQAYAEQAAQYAQSINPAGFAPKSHADSGTQYGTATAGLFGHVKLSDTPGESGAAEGVAVTPAALQAVADVANMALPQIPLNSDPGVNLNDEQTGIRLYNGWDSTQVNQPFANAWGILITIRANNAMACQVAISEYGVVYSRVYNSGWSSWKTGGSQVASVMGQPD